ncbi:DUF2066 domain-containing protein [Thiomicrospira sp. ALE5]|uniref:DUF2066 domain-containing protein n=1 Tax=Thiomicrospira sp. ALE5 TaxID=748650 RepID=UPI0008F3D877|nr:DUF2066 domain-containing protein [Thiomicrospira sp. ALE5]SFR58582.1 hypothetical protein SAMN03092900_1366 [Thiomicrospira sp. ALE5]
MRSLSNITWLYGFLFILFWPVFAPVQASEDFYTVDIEVESFQQAELDNYFAEAIKVLSVRLSGNPEITVHPAVQALIQQPRSWVRNYQLVNRQVDGVVLGQNVRVEFNSARVIEQLQQATIPVWPESERPTILVLGDWLQSGLRADFSAEGLSFRPDLDFRGYPDMIGLPQIYLRDTNTYSSLELVPVPSNLNQRQLQQLKTQFQSASHVLVLSAQVVGEVVQVRGQFYDLLTGQLVWSELALGDTLQSLIEDQFDRVLREESARYYASIDLMSEFWLEINDIPDAKTLTSFEQQLAQSRLIFDQIRLIQVEGRAASFVIRYRGDLDVMLRNVEQALPLNVVVDDRNLSYMRYQYLYLP